jgi:hypothetical protein
MWNLPIIAQLLGNPNGPPPGAQANEAQPDMMDERAFSLILADTAWRSSIFRDRNPASQ